VRCTRPADNGITESGLDRVAYDREIAPHSFESRFNLAPAAYLVSAAVTACTGKAMVRDAADAIITLVDGVITSWSPGLPAVVMTGS
jgi:hypothetical protein